MTVLRAHGIHADLPSGFEGRIYRNAESHGDTTHPVAHFATFSLPPGVADFGSGAVQLMGQRDVFAVLLEYGAESAPRRLFAGRAMPRRLAPDDFKSYRFRVGLAGQSGTQHFFVESGRPFTFYAVLGSHLGRRALIPAVNSLLAGIVIDPVAAIATRP